eukprot:3859417-Prymnesium_polylepis.1
MLCCNAPLPLRNWRRDLRLRTEENDDPHFGCSTIVLLWLRIRRCVSCASRRQRQPQYPNARPPMIARGRAAAPRCCAFRAGPRRGYKKTVGLGFGGGLESVPPPDGAAGSSDAGPAPWTAPGARNEPPPWVAAAGPNPKARAQQQREPPGGTAVSLA